MADHDYLIKYLQFTYSQTSLSGMVDHDYLIRTNGSLPLRHLPHVWSTMTILLRIYSSPALRHLPRVWSTMTILFRTNSLLAFRHLPRVWSNMAILLGPTVHLLSDIFLTYGRS
jgi:hypothetical protein